MSPSGKPAEVVGTPEFVASWSEVQVPWEPPAVQLVSKPEGRAVFSRMASFTCGVCSGSALQFWRGQNGGSMETNLTGRSDHNFLSGQVTVGSHAPARGNWIFVLLSITIM